MYIENRVFHETQDAPARPGTNIQMFLVVEHLNSNITLSASGSWGRLNASGKLLPNSYFQSPSTYTATSQEPSILAFCKNALL